MNRNMRLVVSVLFIVIIVLAVAITRFYSKTEKSAYDSSSQPVVESLEDSDRDGNRIFRDSNGLFGILDSSSRVIVYPEWLDLSFTGSSCCVASKRLDGKRLYGCIDYEGNITVPFVYSEIVPADINGTHLFLAKSADNGRYTIYYRDFTPCFPEVWKSCSADRHELTLRSEKGVYTYTAEKNELIFKKASVNGTAGDNIPFSIELSNIHLLAKLTPALIEIMASDIGGYLDHAFTKGRTVPDDKLNKRYEEFSAIFPDEKDISLTLTDVSDFHIYSISSKEEALVIGVSLKAGTDVKYTEDGLPMTAHGDYKAELRFSGSFEPDFGLAYAKFQRSKPRYPVNASDEQQKNNDQSD